MPDRQRYRALSGLMLFSTISYLGVALMNVLGLVVLLWMAKSPTGFSKVFAAFCASCAASVVVGMTVFQPSGAHAQLLWSSVPSTHIVAVVLSEVVAAIGGSAAGEPARRASEEASCSTWPKRSNKHLASGWPLLIWRERAREPRRKPYEVYHIRR
ncbi:MAG: hypothetical protein ACLSDQ_00930 [Adlercreutzia equolifaciens]